LAAAVLSDLVVNCLITPSLAFNQVLNALVAQAIGSGNPKSAGIWLQQSMFWLSLSMLPFLIGFFHVETILLLLDFPPDICHLAGTYAKFNILWPIPNGLYQCMRFYFQAQGLPRPAMYNNILFLFINAGLNYYFIFICRFGFIGAALSLSVSRSLQPVLYYYYMFVWKQHHRATWPGWCWSYHTKDRTVEFLQQALPNVGTLLFQQVASQATTVLVGRLGTTAIAVSSALSTIAMPLAGTVSATSWTVSSVRVGYHLGRGDAVAARKSAELVLLCITVVTGLAGGVAFFGRRQVLAIATNDEQLIAHAVQLIPAMLAGTYLSLIVGNITSGVFSGIGRPLLATILSFGFELPLSILGVAVYILHFHGNLMVCIPPQRKPNEKNKNMFFCFCFVMYPSSFLFPSHTVVLVLIVFLFFL
jgi:multidrug resistance protein, MATE family